MRRAWCEKRSPRPAEIIWKECARKSRKDDHGTCEVFRFFSWKWPTLLTSDATYTLGWSNWVKRGRAKSAPDSNFQDDHIHFERCKSVKRDQRQKWKIRWPMKSVQLLVNMVEAKREIFVGNWLAVYANALVDFAKMRRREKTGFETFFAQKKLDHCWCCAFTLKKIVKISKFEKSFFSSLTTQWLSYPCGEIDQLIVHFNFAKNGWAKIRFAWAEGIFSETKVDNYWSLFPKG